MHFLRLLAVCGLLAVVGCSTTSEIDGLESKDLCWIKCMWCLDIKFFCGDISVAEDDRETETGDPGAAIKMKGKTK